MLPVTGDDPPHLLLTDLAPPHVMTAEGPRGRRSGSTGQGRPGEQHPRGSAHHHPTAQWAPLHPHLTGPRPVVPGAGALRAFPQRDGAVPRTVVEDEMRARVGQHQLHRHREGKRSATGPGTATGPRVPQPVGTVPQPRPRGPSPEPEEPGVGTHLGPLHPVRRAPRHRLPPPRCQLPAQHHAPRSEHLHRAVPRDGYRHPLGDHPPAAVGVRLQHRPRIRVGTAPGQRVRRFRSRPVPAPEDGPVHGDADPQLGTAEPDDTTPGPGFHLPYRPGSPRALRPARGRPGGIGPPPAPRCPYGAHPLSRPHRADRFHRTHQVTTVHGAHPATARTSHACRSTAVHP